MYDYQGSAREVTKSILRRQNSKGSIVWNSGKHLIRSRNSDIHCACVECSEFRRPCSKKSQCECDHSKTSEFRLFHFQALNQEFPESGATESRNSYFTSKRVRNFRRWKFTSSEIPALISHIFRAFRNYKIRVRNVEKSGILSGFRGGSATLCLCMDVSHLARSCEREVRAWWRCGTGVGAHV